jgi:hypothetical protein
MFASKLEVQMMEKNTAEDFVVVRKNLEEC